MKANEDFFFSFCFIWKCLQRLGIPNDKIVIEYIINGRVGKKNSLDKLKLTYYWID